MREFLKRFGRSIAAPANSIRLFLLARLFAFCWCGVANTHVKPRQSLVLKWASDHRAQNAYHMGPKNWERCLHDLGYPGGVRHELVYEADGTLKYQ